MSQHQSQSENGSEDEARVITVGWQVVMLPVVGILVVLLGFFAGRALSSSSSSSAADQPVAVSGAVQGVPDQFGQQPATNPNVIQISPSDSAGGFGDQVIDLPVRSHPLLNQPAPDFEMTLLDTGETVSISDFAGQPMMVNFWATWCPPCRYEMPWIQTVHDENAEAGLVVLAVNAGERVPPSMVNDTVTQFVDSMGLTFPVLMGDNTFEVQRTWSVSGLPATFFVNSEGVVIDTHAGMFPNLATLQDKVSKLYE